MRHVLTYKIFEDRRQLELPFDKKKSIFNRPIHVHVVDALQDMSVMPAEKYFSKGNISNAWNKAYPAALKMYKESDFGQDVYMEFVYMNKPWNDDADDPLWVQAYLKDNEWDAKPEGHNESDMMNDMSDQLQREGIDKLVTERGMTAWNYFQENYFDEQVEDNGVFYTVENSYGKNEHGLIDVWRAVDYVLEKGDDRRKLKDVYAKIIKKYKGVGMYWTWDSKKAETYWGSSAPGKVELVLHGRVAVDDVDWPETIFKNGSNLREEKEIKIRGNVLIHAIEDEKSNKKIELDTPVVVPAGIEMMK